MDLGWRKYDFRPSHRSTPSLNHFRKWEPLAFRRKIISFPVQTFFDYLLGLRKNLSLDRSHLFPPKKWLFTEKVAVICFEASKATQLHPFVASVELLCSLNFDKINQSLLLLLLLLKTFKSYLYQVHISNWFPFLFKLFLSTNWILHLVKESQLIYTYIYFCYFLEGSSSSENIGRGDIVKAHSRLCMLTTFLSYISISVVMASMLMDECILLRMSSKFFSSFSLIRAEFCVLKFQRLKLLVNIFFDLRGCT